jgi:adenylate kinase family enzyme
MMKLHILGAPGAGVTTLGRALAEKMGVAHFDTDDYHWFTDDALPYRRRRNPDHRRLLLGNDFAAHEHWVLSGALCGWGDVFTPHFNAVVWLWAPADVRLERIRAREHQRYGAERLAPGGDLHVVYEKFLQWAAAYDDASANIRSREQELTWVNALTCPQLIINEVMDGPTLLSTVDAWIKN